MHISNQVTKEQIYMELGRLYEPGPGGKSLTELVRSFLLTTYM